MRRHLLRTAAALALALVAACTQKNTADVQDQTGAAAADVALGVNRFLLFPNPIGTDPFALDGGTFETNTTAYTTAYYAAIDAGNAKDTIDKWRAANGFTGYANPARPGTEHLGVFRDVKDLGYGRRMTGRFNSDDNSVAFYVENYNVNPNGSAGYASDLNVDAAIRRDTQWHVGTNAIEWSTTPCLNIANGYPYNYDPPDCNGTVKFAKYFNFSSKDGTRQLAVDLDGHGLKAMPGPCITCHGGRGDPLTPPDSAGNPARFPLVENAASRKRGDVQARLHGMNVDSFSYSTTQAGFAKSDLQPILKDFNQWILCTYPSPTLTPGLTVSGTWTGSPCTRPTAGANEWQGTAGPMIESWYGGTGMPNGTFSDTYIPAGWNAGATVGGITDTALYQNVVAPYCRTCHILRGTANQNDIDFMMLGAVASGVNPATGFRSFDNRIKVMVFDRGNMPLAQIPHQDFWSSSAPQTLASFVDAILGAGTATDSSGAPLMPGRPIADPGPDRMVRTGANAVLTGENSLFASSYSWTNVSGPSSPSITNPTGIVAIFNASVAGSYVVNLSVNGGASSKNVTITVDDNFPDPLNIKFAQVKNVLQNVLHKGTTRCVDCHKDVANAGNTATTPPIWYTRFDRDNDGTINDSGTNTTDDDWFLKAVSGRVNLTEIAASPLLRKPTGNHHNAGKVIDVADALPNGGLWNYSVLYNWILAGMQPGGVAANSIVNSGALGTLATPVLLTYSGSPLLSTPIPADASASVNATSYLWSVTGPLGPTGAVASFADPTAATTTLNVPNTGSYQVKVQVGDGNGSSDVVQRALIVGEATINANFNPQQGSVLVTFGAFNTGTITLSSNSTYGAISPTTCRWEVPVVPAGGVGTTLDGFTTLDVTKPCATPATLTVPIGAAGQQYQVRLTASTLASSTPVSHLLTVSNSAPTASLANTTTPQTPQFSATSTVSIPTHTSVSGGTAGTATISVVTATVSLNGSASTTPPSTGTLSYAWCLLSQPDATNFPASLPVCPTTTSTGTTSSVSMTARATGSYNVQLTVTNNFSSNTVSRAIAVNPAHGVRFSDFTGTSNNGFFSTFTCLGCHSYSPSAVQNPASNLACCEPPQWDNVTGSDGTTLYQRVMQRVVPGAPASSLLLLNPENVTNGINTNGHGGGCINNFGCGVGNSSNATTFSNWITDGAPPGN